MRTNINSGIDISYMLTNEDIYRDPFEFYPERYLPKPDGNGEPVPKAAFGFGRR